MDRADPRYDEIAKGLRWSSREGTLAGSRRLCVSWTAEDGSEAWRYHELTFEQVCDAKRVPSYGALEIADICEDMQREIIWLVSAEVPS